jgi:signal transduction histidine kinase
MDAASRERLADLGQSVAELVHDLRGPLTTIAGFADLMSIEDDAEKRRDFFAEISAQIERLTRLSGDTLAFARGEQPLLKRTVHLYDLGSQLEALLSREFCGTGVAPELDLRYRGPVELDEPQFLRVVENLAHNAREAMAGGRGTRFSVRVERSNDELVFSFSDDGPGLPEEVRDHLFESFATAGKHQGTGLGLHLVRKIAEQHGGCAVLRPARGGTCIEVRLPAR